MALDPALERPRTSEAAGFSDAVTCAFADESSGVHGTVRIGLAGGAASGLTMVFVGGVPAIAHAEGGVEVGPDVGGHDELHAAGIDHRVIEPHRRWTVGVGLDGVRLELELEATGPPFVLAPGTPAARRGGMEGYEQPCRVRGRLELQVPGEAPRTIELDGVGQRGHQWGAPDWDTLELSRTITGWFGDDLAFNVSALRPAGARSHADEVAWSSVSRPPAMVARGRGDEDEDEETPEPSDVPEAVDAPEPRVSTTVNAEGRHTFATVELWESDEGPVWTATGEPVAGTTLELGRLRLDMAFFRWRMNGRTGVGRYDVLRRVED
ncbi:hypothetical protein [Patulibacter sp.]|uniref:hypothetical protein n=1 Tax=Patulibacter sp. TaxID=1912859 RepID=UPI002719B027|nr:hypothetical protein [Patulibacter sp.]MDO9407558.1 hypothetical protein [Patulibacter sp.]